MFTLRKVALIAAVVVGGMSSAAMADHARYKVIRIPGGPRPDQYMTIRIDRPAARERPYALTGIDRDESSRRKAKWPTMLHPRGTHGNY